MGPAVRQFRALLWKNWLCRLRQPVSARCLVPGPMRWGGRGAGQDLSSGLRGLIPQDQCKTEPVAFCQNRPNLEKLKKKKKWNLSSNWCFGHLVKTKLQIFWLKGQAQNAVYA